MTTSKKTQTTAPLAHRVPAEVSDLIATYGAWLEEQTGQKIDSMSVYLGSQLRGTFQKSEGNQARLAAATAARIKREADRAEAQAARQAEADKKAAEPKADKPAPKRPTVKADKPVPATKAPARRRPTKPAAVATTNEAVQA